MHKRPTETSKGKVNIVGIINCSFTGSDTDAPMCINRNRSIISNVFQLCFESHFPCVVAAGTKECCP